ncbi:uncharacterized protein LOC132741138 [Ruditapes philippinarum]|uniref:uncharacterized protein LOC132741138 n=1 Tax=Ruditapes philippinarum TaxID=129788 RepID=UPI00295A577B|nr:uncharacterized protein LOC132741138 [Ruditapes philippinarum]
MSKQDKYMQELKAQLQARTDNQRPYRRKINLTSCIHNTVTVKIENTPEGGIAYFRTDTAYNLVQTTGGTLVHECKFEECNINWDEKFHVVVQRYVYIQTHHDVIIWFICNTDFGAIQPLDIDFLGNEDSNFTLVKYKPEVSLMLYNGGARLDSGSAVKLGDELTMIMTVTNNVNDYFDISAKACYASGIILLEDHCPVDENLFGLFNSTAHGYLVNTFGMFRPTNIAGGPTEVVFTCILKVCMWNCQEVTSGYFYL